MQGSVLTSPARVLVILVRHGNTEDNESGVLRGWADQPLDNNGGLQAQLAARKITIYRPKFVYHDDLLRGTMTGEIIANNFSIPSEVDYNLRTANVGVWTEQPEENVREYELFWYQNPWKEALSGESFNQFCNRFFTCFDKKIEQAKLDAYRPTVLITHGRNIAALNWRYNGGNAWEADMTVPGGVTLVRDNGPYFPPYTLEFLSPTEPIIADE